MGTMQSLAICLQLLCIAFALTIQEGVNVAAFMSTRFVIDNPVAAIDGTEAAVDDVHPRALFSPDAHAVLGARFRLRS